MSMTERERLGAVYRGETPDQASFFLDLSHWFNHRFGRPYDLTEALCEPDGPLIEYHRRVNAGFYVPNQVSYHDAAYPPDVTATATKIPGPGGTEIAWRIQTPLGAIERRCRWEEASYSWSVSRWGVESERDLRVLAYALGRLEYRPRFERYLQWQEALGDVGFAYMPIGYSAMGHLLSYWMGIERTIFAAADMPEVLHEVVDQINEGLLRSVDMVCASPSPVIFMGDNFWSDIQPPHRRGHARPDVRPDAGAVPRRGGPGLARPAHAQPAPGCGRGRPGAARGPRAPHLHDARARRSARAILRQ